MTRFDWDSTKCRENLRKHGVSFQTASLVFEDPWILSRKDLSHDDAEDRYDALGEIGGTRRNWRRRNFVRRLHVAGTGWRRNHSLDLGTRRIRPGKEVV
jgi:uncharacterized DUF497 family protein